jgi:hypothetical protein
MINGYKEVFHILIAAFILLGWLFAPIIHGPSCIGILAHWFINKNRCIFSDNYKDNNGFTTGLLAKIGINIEGNELLKTIIPYILVSIPAAISIYMAFNNINLGGGLVYDIGKYIAPAVPLVLTGNTLFKSFASGIQDGQKQANSAALSDNIFGDDATAATVTAATVTAATVTATAVVAPDDTAATPAATATAATIVA